MKQLLILFTLLIFSFNLIAGTYESRINKDQCRQISITIDGTTAYVTITLIDNKTEIEENWFNTTSFNMFEGEIEIPIGKNVIFIPFGDGDPMYIQNGGTVTRSCDCFSGSGGDVGGGTCTSNGNSCPNGSKCQECHWSSTGSGGGGSIIIIGGGVLIEATNVVFQ